MFGRGKALFGLLSAIAVMLPAAALAYLGVRSNQAERERARAAFVAGNQKEARFLAGALDNEAGRTLDALAPLFGDGPLDPAALRRASQRWPLAEHVFFVDERARVIWPAPDGRLPDLRRSASTNEGVQGYLRRVRAEREQAELLGEARRAEARSDGAARARRSYASLAEGDGDAAAQALLGLARLDRRSGQPEAAGRRLGELRQRFGDEVDEEGLGYGLLADLGQAASDPGRDLDLYRGLLEEAYPAPPAARAVLLSDVRARLALAPLPPAERSELVRLNQREHELDFGAALRGVASELLVLASGEPASRSSPVAGHRWLVFRRHGAGVLGFQVDLPGLEAAAERARQSEIAAENLAGGSAVRLHADPLAAEDMTVTRGFLAAERPRLLSGLTLSLWGDAGAADRAARGQLWRYLALVAGLVMVMLFGVVAINRGAARERELGKLKSDFVSTVSHELKTPLTSIRMFAEMLREGVAGDDGERQRRYHDVIVRESERLGRLIANVLDFSQVERGARRYDRRPVSASALAEEAVETFRRLADGEGQPLSLEVASEAAHLQVSADREALVQSLLNLLSNASKYGGREHPVVVRVGTRDGEVSLSVADQGPGIAAADHKRIFREFWRAPEAVRSGVEGTGLGLALVKRHIEAHGGRIDLSSEPGRGATFTLVLPRAMPTSEEEAT